jgi:hypothetical protein
MSKSKIALIAALAGMSVATPAFAQSGGQTGSVLPYHYEGDKRVWGSWRPQNHEGDRRREGASRSPGSVVDR